MLPGCHRAGRWLRWSGFDLRSHTDGDVPVGGQAECGGGEHGKIFTTRSQIWFPHCMIIIYTQPPGHEGVMHICCLQMTSVERVVEYTELESEAPWETEKRPPPDWPSKGLVTFDRVSFSYSRGGPLVLKDISATFQPKEKVRHLCPTHRLLFFFFFFPPNAHNLIVVSRVSGRRCGSNRCWEKLSGLSSVPPSRASGQDLHRRGPDL